MFFLNHLLQGILAGLTSGLITGFLFYSFAYNREKTRKVIEYAQKTADHTFQICEEARNFSDEKNIENIKQLLRKTIHRPFAGNIVDKTKESKELQEAIAQCNRSINEIDKFLENANQDENLRRKLYHESLKMSDTLLNIWNAIASYNVAEEKRIKRTFSILKIIFVVIFVVIVVILLANVLVYYLL